MYHIMIVEDDRTIAGLLKSNLVKWGFQAECVESFETVLDEFIRTEPQLVLMDISLPFYNGYYWCSEIRKCSKVPIIFISSANDNMNIVMAINMGGDDFIAKPFDMAVVVAKIQALLRRAYSFQGQTSFLECKGAVLHLSDATLSYQEQKLPLTKNDFKILQVLMEQKGSTVSREQLMKRLWDSDCFIDDNTLTVNITRLRKKLEEIGLGEMIVTKKGSGYIVTDE